MTPRITTSTQNHLSALVALDGHLDADQLDRKLSAGEVLHAEIRENIVGLLRFGLFWDKIPFMNLIRVAEKYQRQGIGVALVAHWESAMRAAGHKLVLTSTQADEQAQHFYRALGYVDTGGFVLPGEPFELILTKQLA